MKGKNKYNLILSIFFLFASVFFFFSNRVNAQTPGRECSSEVMMVLDESGSILPSIAAVESTAKSFIDRLMGDPALRNRGGVVWYASAANLRQTLTYDRDLVKAAISGPHAGGGTRMDAGIQTAANELNSASDPGVQKLIIHLTDGVPSSSASAIAAFDSAKGSGIKIINIGLGSGVNDAFLKTNASQNCPSAPALYAPSCYWKAPTSADLDGIYNSILSIVGDTDGDGYTSIECGGDDCESADGSVYPGAPCYNKCFGNVLMGGICEAGTGQCVYDTTVMSCEGIGDECRIDFCAMIAGADDQCQADAGMSVCGGIVPCGRLADNPETYWDDTVSCDFCHIMLMIDIVMDFLVTVAFTVAILGFIVTGLLFILSGGNAEKRKKAKDNLKWVIIGFIIILLAWLIVDFLLSVWGFLDPMGGEWNVVCD